MIELFNIQTNLTMIVVLTIVYFIASSIEVFDIRLIQARRDGVDEQMLPEWTAIFIWINWVIVIALLFINWKYALGVMIVKFILKILPVLEIIGNILTSPLRKK
jgi:hypothetical protein